MPSYLDELLNIENIHFEQMVDKICPTELQLNSCHAVANLSGSALFVIQYVNLHQQSGLSNLTD